MAPENITADADAHRHLHPTVRNITAADLKEVLIKGLADFNAMPTHLVFLALIYPVATFFVIRYYGHYDMLPFLFPLLAGYTLAGPLVAVGMYELSRRRESGADVSRWHAFSVIHSPQIVSIAGLALVLMAIYFVWMSAAWALYQEVTGGVPPESIEAFAALVFTTGQGQTLILVGCSMGMVFAIIVLSISVISFPMLLDKNVGVLTAIQTSVNVVFTNPVTMAAWGLIVTCTLLVGALPVFVGLAVVLPVLGHATWHLYRKVVEY